jgi:hypothetical protein
MLACVPIILSQIYNFSKEVAKTKWKGLSDNFRKELKKLEKPKSGDSRQPIAPRWVHFTALQFVKVVMEPRNTSGNIPAPEEHEDDDDSTAWTQFQEAGTSTVEEEALSVDPYLDTISTHSDTADKSFCRKRRGNTKYNHQQEMLNLERKIRLDKTTRGQAGR